MAKVSIVQTMDWQKQALEESLKWHQACGEHEEKELNAFRAGYAEGWAELRKILSRHGYEFG